MNLAVGRSLGVGMSWVGGMMGLLVVWRVEGVLAVLGGRSLEGLQGWAGCCGEMCEAASVRLG